MRSICTALSTAFAESGQHLQNCSANDICGVVGGDAGGDAACVWSKSQYGPGLWRSIYICASGRAK